MKVTVELPDGLAQRAERLAHEQSTTMPEVIISGLERELDRRSLDSVHCFDWVTCDGQGIRIDPATAICQSYQLQACLRLPWISPSTRWRDEGSAHSEVLERGPPPCSRG